MHERKTQMAELADAFVALPGGLGALEESFEVWTWAHLGLHAKLFASGPLNAKKKASPPGWKDQFCDDRRATVAPSLLNH